MSYEIQNSRYLEHQSQKKKQEGQMKKEITNPEKGMLFDTRIEFKGEIVLGGQDLGKYYFKKAKKT